MGIVYRALHLATGRFVALKTVCGATVSTLSSIRREIAALSRLKHDGVARIVAHGVCDQLPWYAMELLEGRTLRDFISERFAQGGDAEHRIVDVLNIVHRICRPLAYLHSHGIVHRDLKPENVFLRKDGSPVLVDFGIAMSFGDSGECAIAENMLEVAGTPEYMSPEQIQSRSVDARSDLYALGCVLFECLTGRTPFQGKTLGAVISRHVSGIPQGPSRLAPGVSANVDALVLRLLAKRPSDRFGYADDVANELVRCGAEVEPDDARPETRAYVYRPEFAGRADTMLRFDAIVRGRGTLPRRVLIHGESGVGKTRVLLELSCHAAFRGFVVVPVQCVGAPFVPGDSPTLAAPFEPFRAFLQRVADAALEGGPELAETLLADRADVLAVYEPALQSFANPRIEGPEPLAGLTPEAARSRVFGCLRETLLAYASGRPLLLLVDDLQWGDELTIAFLSTLGDQELELHDVYVIAACRSDEDAQVLQNDLSRLRFERIALHRLSKDAIGEMIAGMLALERAPPNFSEFLFRESSGNPFVVAEYLRAAIDQGLLQRDAAGRWQLSNAERKQALSAAPVGAPISVRQLMQRRISSLAPSTLRLAQAAALLGRDFDASLLDVLTRGQAGSNLETLRDRQIFEEGNAGRLRFVHDQLRELAYRSIPESEVIELHRSAAIALEQSSEAPAARAALLPMLAQQWSSAKVPDRAAAYHALAGDRAREVYANEEALKHYASALEAARSLTSDANGDAWSTVVRQMEERRAELLTLVGRNAAARASLRNALESSCPSTRLARSRLLWKFARTFENEHDHAQALRLYREAEQVLGELRAEVAEPLPSEWPLIEPTIEESSYWGHAVNLQVEQVWVHYWLADVEAMTRLVERVRPVIEKHGQAHQRARLLQALIHSNLRRDRYAVPAENVEFARTSLAAASTTRDPGGIAYAEFVLGFQLLFSDALVEAETRMSDALAAAERTGDRTL